MAANRTDKGLGQALRRYYPRAFVMHQDVVFRVNGRGQALPGIQEDKKESKRVANTLRNQPGLVEKVWERILDELEIVGFSKADIEEQQALGDSDDDDYDLDDKLTVIVPSKIELRLDKGLNVARCEKCGLLNYVNHMFKDKGLPTHKSCTKSTRSRYRQAPVFVPSPKDPTEAAKVGCADQISIKTILPQQVNCYYFKQGGFCTHPSGDGQCDTDMEKQHSYMWINPSYPFRGIKIFNNGCPKGLGNIPTQPLISHRGGNIGGGYKYTKTFPNAGLTQRLYTTVAWEGEKHTEDMNRLNNEIEEIKKTWFNGKLVNFEETKFSRITVLDLVYGIKVGGYYDHWLRGPGENNVLGRMLKTQGFVITLTGEIWKEAVKLDGYKSPDDKDPLEDRVYILAHTLEHAIRNHVPIFTGIDENLFGGSYEILPDKKGAKIYLYDNEVGGHGGFATLLNSKASRFVDMINTVRRQTLCPIRKCKRGCKQCLFIRGCGLGNARINRRMLLDSGILQPQQSE